MTRLVLIRHAATAWNRDGRLQGRADVPLGPAGRAALAGRRLPASLGPLAWIASPLRRAVETARRLGAADLRIEPRLTEMDWGHWEGRRLADLRAELGPAMAANEARGLDFRPPGGESPGDVQDRLAPWLAELTTAETATVAVTHKGVIRALLALATGWDMRAEPPLKLDWDRAHVFTVAGSAIAPERVNLMLDGP